MWFRFFDPENTNRTPPVTLNPLQASEFWLYDMGIFSLTPMRVHTAQCGTLGTNRPIRNRGR
jgi:hypothetical protein